MEQMQSPVITSLDTAQLKSVLSFMDNLRSGGKMVAKLESVRLEPYLKALSQHLAKDLEKESRPELGIKKGLKDKKYLLKLFNAVARRGGNTILSEIMVAPDNLLQEKSVMDGNRQFNGVYQYNYRPITLGFIQVFDKEKNGSTSVPLLSFYPFMMKEIEKLHPEVMLKEFQNVMTAGNHDMLHHYSSAILNPNIAKTENSGDKAFQKWQAVFSGGDNDPTSYESWLMLNHMRTRRLMEKGPEGVELRQSCDRFFDELSRIGKEISSAKSVDKAHDVVDYFNTAIGFAMMRFMPLNHPLFDHAIDRMKDADPDADAIKKKEKVSVMKNSYQSMAIINYALKGMNLQPKNGGYSDLKKLDLINLAPSIAYLLSPAEHDPQLEKVHSRVGEVNLGMIEAAVESTYFLADGVHYQTKENGAVIEMHIKDHELHCETGPAYAEMKTDGSHLVKWYKNGQLHRKGGPASINKDADGADTCEEWYTDGKMQRYISKFLGDSYEKWYKDGKLHREDGPAYVEIRSTNGSRKEAWYKDGQMYHCIRTLADGSRSEEWYNGGMMQRTIETRFDGSRTECLYKDGLKHHSIDTGIDGSRTESWWDKWELIKKETYPAKTAPAIRKADTNSL